MKRNAAKEIAALEQMTVRQLKRRHVEVFSEESRSGNRDFLRKRIAWRLQALAEGDLSERARRRAEELANDADLRVRMPRGKPSSAGATTAGKVNFSPDGRLPMSGAVLTREYKGRTIRVTVLDNGFEYAGDVYRSLSAVAKAVTGSHWSGYLFFGLRKAKETT